MPTQSVIETVSQVLAATENLSIQFDPPADEARDGRFVPLAASSLHSELREVVGQVAPQGMFTHQHSAIESVLAGRHTIAATRTSSGKSLIFALPALDAMCRDDSATSLFLYPQKALANDQLAKLRGQVSAVPSLAKLQAAKPFLVSRYDGGVPTDDRKAIREQVQLLLTNPDMLHLGILQHHETGWARFFANLKTVAIDECHEYRGIFGTNVAYVLRRLRQICSQHGSNPTFVATSATIADPQQHLHNLVGTDFDLVGPEQDGSLQGRRKFWMVGSTEHHYQAGRKLATSLADAGLNVLAFCPSRVSAERMLSKMRDADGELPKHVAVYRSGLTASEREDIESQLRSGAKKLVFSTSALELGIDIGGLDVVVCIGLPSSMMSLWQRAGRVARAGREGAIVLVPGESPLDTYYAQRPDELFTRQNETLALNLSNERVSCQHYTCAVHETGKGETGLQLEVLGDQIAKIQSMRDAGKLQRAEFYCADPHIEVSLRNTGECNYQLICGNETIGDLGSFHLLREAPRNALYRHNGRTYRVKDVIRGKRIVRVVPERTRNETTSYVQKTIRQKTPLRMREYPQLTLSVSRLDVTEYLKAVSEKDASGKTVRNHSPAGMPTHYLPTEGVCLVLSQTLMAQLQDVIEVRLDTALASIERLMANLFPTVSGPCDSQDYSSGIDRTRTGELAIFLYDNVYDGVNLTEIVFDRLPELLGKVRQRVESCDCSDDAGCVRCIADPMRESLSSKVATLSTLQSLQDILESKTPATVEFAPSDEAGSFSPTEVECPACQAQVKIPCKFCSNCGHSMQEPTHAHA
ncbi:MAG: DEAD/DEAH box helicase [Pirellulaceae bacterium]|nr:DEAD/DEAH box helicase [Pirellulaceae bacterium]